MKATGIREEKVSLYVKEPYSRLIPKNLSNFKENNLLQNSYCLFYDLTILFQGFGKSTVVSFKQGDEITKLEIPNDHLIALKHEN